MTDYPALGKALIDKLGKSECLYGKGGFWVKDDKFYTVAQARRITGVKATLKPRRERIRAYGDYATIAMLNGIKI